MADKIKTGIPGLDAMTFGGIPAGSQILLSGGPGAGKTLLAFEFLYRSAKMGQNCLFLALEEGADRVVANIKSTFTEWKDLDELITSKRLQVDGEDPSTVLRTGKGDPESDFNEIVSDIERLINERRATRVVIDSVSLLELVMNDSVVYRKSLLNLVGALRRLGVVSVSITEMQTPERTKLQFKPEYFIFDGIMAMYQTGEEAKRIRGIEIIKMRGTRHSFVTTPYDISPNGFKIFSTEDMSQY